MGWRSEIYSGSQHKLIASGDTYIVREAAGEVSIGADASTDVRIKPGFLELSEITDPGTPGSNKGWLYSKDDGGVTKLYFESTTGVTDLLAGVATPPGGSPGQIQWNSASAFGGTDNAYWDNAQDVLTIGGQTTSLYNTIYTGLQISKYNANASAGVFVTSTTATHYPSMRLYRSRGTLAIPTPPSSGDNLGSFEILGAWATTWSSTALGASIEAYATQTWSGTGTGTKLAFKTVNTGSGGAGDERYSIEGNSDHVWYGAGTSSAQIFKLDATNIYAVAPSTASPASAAEGAFFYDTTADVFKFGQGSTPAWVTIPASVPSQLSDLSDVGTTTATAGRLLVADGDSWESQAVSGAITMSGAGATAFIATDETSADDADLLLIYDDTAAAYRRMTRANFLTGVGGGSPAGSGTELQYRVDASTFGATNVSYDTTNSGLALGAITGIKQASFDFQLGIDNAESKLVSSVASNTATHKPVLYLLRAKGTHASPILPTTGMEIGSIEFGSIYNSTWNAEYVGASINAYTTATWGSSNTGTKLDFKTVNTTTSGIAVRYVIEGNSDQIWYGAGASPSQIFKLDATNVYAVAPSTASPASAAEGAFFYDTTADVFKFGQGASPAWVTIPTAVGSETFVGLTDAPSSYTTANALYSTNGTPDAVIELGTTITESSGRFTITKDSSYLDIASGHISVSACNLEVTTSCSIDQNLVSTGSPVFASVKFVNANASITQVTSNMSFYDVTTGTKTLAQLAAATAPGGTSGQLQWNNTNAFDGTSKIVWDSSGYALLIGGLTSEPWSASYGLIVSGAAKAGVAILAGTSTDADGPKLALVRGEGTESSPTVVTSGSVLGDIEFMGLTTSGWVWRTAGAFIRSTATEDWSGSVNGAKFEILTVNSTDAAVATRYSIEGNSDHVWYGSGESSSEQMRLDVSAGALEIPAPTTAPTLSRNSTVAISISQSTNELIITAKYSDGTAKTATIAFD